MPKLKHYVNDRGYYINTQIQNSVITFQVSPTAANILEELDYRGGSDVPWRVLEPLIDSGEVYTKANRDGDDLQNDSSDSGLTADEEEILEQYLHNKDPGSEFGEIRKFVEDTVPEFKQEHIIREIQNSEALFNSLKDVVEHPDEKLGFHAGGNTLTAVIDPGNTGSVKLLVADRRFDPSSQIDFHIGIHSPEGQISARVMDGYLVSWNGPSVAEGGLPKPNVTEETQQKVHKKIFSQVDSAIDSGYDPIEYPSRAIQRFFLFIPYYDLRPNPKAGGHRRVGTAEELEGQHIWVPTHRMTSSTSQSSNCMIDQELIQFTTKHQPGSDMILVEVPTGKHIDQVTGVRPSN